MKLNQNLQASHKHSCTVNAPASTVNVTDNGKVNVTNVSTFNVNEYGTAQGVARRNNKLNSSDPNHMSR